MKFMASTEDEIPLEDIDKILAAEDPDFAKSLEEVRAVEVDKSVVIEASAIDETLGEEAIAAQAEPAADTQENFLKRSIRRFKTRIQTARQNFKHNLRKFAADALIFLKTKPKEYALFGFALLRQGLKAAGKPLKAFAAAPRIFQIGVLIFAFMIAATASVLIANLKGIWIPHLMEPLLTSLADHAEFVEEFDPKTETQTFYAAFPQDVHQFLFKKFKVNLRRTQDNPNPMGAFELVVEVDSKDTAVELNDREVELHDFLQRLFEEETYTDLVSDLGKARVKSRIKKELNTKLTQGWTRDVSFKTFVLKP